MDPINVRCGWLGCTRPATTAVEWPAEDPALPGDRSWSAGVDWRPACGEHASIVRAEVAATWGLPPVPGDSETSSESDADVVAVRAPSVVLLDARTDAARAWLNERTQARRFQWTAMGVAVDWRIADSLIDRLRQEGFTVADRR